MRETFVHGKIIVTVVIFFVFVFNHGGNLTKKTSADEQVFTYVSRNGGADEEGQIIRPGQKLVLLPPSFHNKAHVESQHERHRYGFARVAEIITNFFENSAKKKGEKRKFFLKTIIPGHIYVLHFVNHTRISQIQSEI